jgi:hypothetical protein
VGNCAAFALKTNGMITSGKAKNREVDSKEYAAYCRFPTKMNTWSYLMKYFLCEMVLRTRLLKLKILNIEAFLFQIVSVTRI